MRVLVACECSGRVRDAFIARGHDAMSCDLEPKVKGIVRSIELAKPLVHEVNLIGMKIDPVRPIGITGIDLMLEGDYLQELGAKEESE